MNSESESPTFRFSDAHAISIEHFKCFGDTKEASSVIIGPITIVVGRNNSGKSAVIDAMEALLGNTGDISPSKLRKGRLPRIRLVYKINESIARMAKKSMLRARLNFDERAMQYMIGKLCWATLSSDGSAVTDVTFTEDFPSTKLITLNPSETESMTSSIRTLFHKSLRDVRLLRVDASRDIRPEKFGDPLPNGSGIGLTNLLRFYSEDVRANRKQLAELLIAINVIMQPDAEFQEVLCLRDGDQYEIHLRDEEGREIRLSESGSGLKTVVLVVAFFLLYIPLLSSNDDNVLRVDRQFGQFILAIEEPENNLHPSLLRRLLRYVVDRSKEGRVSLLVATHSNVAIDFLARQDDAKIVHVFRRNGDSACIPVNSWIQRNQLLDDLGVLASDLLQANSLIWVEGPSDRAYIKRWMDILSGAQLIEGVNYSFVYYGGSVLSHFTADDDVTDQSVSDLVNILRINRRTCIVMDRDTPSGKKYQTKLRIADEVEKNGGMSWVTQGRTIENYLGRGLIAKFLDIAEGQISVDVSLEAEFGEVLDGIRDGAGRRYLRAKPENALAMSRLIDSSDLGIHDLMSRVGQLVGFIKKAESAPEVGGGQ